MDKMKFNWTKLNALLQFNPSKKFCAEYMEVSSDTIDRRIKDNFQQTFSEYKHDKLDRTRLKLQQTAIQKALKGDNTMLIFCLKNMCKWADKLETENINKEIKIEIASDELDL